MFFFINESASSPFSLFCPLRKCERSPLITEILCFFLVQGEGFQLQSLPTEIKTDVLSPKGFNYCYEIILYK